MLFLEEPPSFLEIRTIGAEEAVRQDVHHLVDLCLGRSIILITNTCEIIEHLKDTIDNRLLVGLQSTDLRGESIDLLPNGREGI